MNVEQELRSIIGKKMKDVVVQETKLSDAGLDSLDLIEIAFDIEDRFKIHLPQLGSETLSVTFGDLCRLVEERLQTKTETVLSMPASGNAASS